MNRRYLSLIPFEEAIDTMKKSAPPPGRAETVLIDRAVGRVLSEPVYARFTVPGTNVASMGALAVHSAQTRAATDKSPLVLADAARINTGQPLPPSYDAVIMIEDVWEEDGKWLIRKPASPWQNVRQAGEDIRKGDLILPRRHQVRAVDIGALASYGIAFVNVLSVRVGIISTGSELVPLGIAPAPEQGVESNNFMAEAYLSCMGATCKRYPLVPDDRDRIADQLLHAVKENDLVLLSAGSSAGTTDFAEGILESSGRLLFHGVGIKPGKPVMMGIVGGVPVLGMPGYPVAAHTIVREFAARLLEYWGMAPYPTYKVKASLGQTLASDLGYEEFVPVCTGIVDGRCVAIPLSRGFGVQSALVRSDGYIRIPSSDEGIEATSEVEVTSYSSPSRLGSSVLAVGSQDIPLDILADRVIDRGIALRCCPSNNLWSMLALRSGVCHAAPMHVPVIGGETLPGFFPAQNDFSLSRIVLAEQPLGIASRERLAGEDLRRVRILNVQRGTAQRMVLDAYLAKIGISPSVIEGYADEVKNPDIIAPRIAARIADAGICTSRAAESAGLVFLPLGMDSYELVTNARSRRDPRMEEVQDAIRSNAYKDQLRALGGYDTRNTGAIRN